MEAMDNGVAELLVKVAEENQTRKILALINECKDIDEVKSRVRALLE